MIDCTPKENYDDSCLAPDGPGLTHFDENASLTTDQKSQANSENCAKLKTIAGEVAEWLNAAVC